MLRWDDDQDTDPQIDEEHHKLYRLMGRLEPVILGGRRTDTVERAVRVLHRRMEEHFRMEEELAADSDASSLAILMDDHRDILEILNLLHRLPTGDEDGRRRLFARFLDALATHDEVVDAPFFRMTMH